MQSKSIFIQGKTQFRLNEVCSISGVKPYVLRFWENEFTEIKPALSASGEKFYSQKDLDLIIIIKKLLFRDKLTIEKAKYELKLHPFLNESGLDTGKIENTDFESSNSSTNTEEKDDLDQFNLVKERLKTIILKSESIEKSHNWFQA